MVEGESSKNNENIGVNESEESGSLLAWHLFRRYNGEGGWRHRNGISKIAGKHGSSIRQHVTVSHSHRACAGAFCSSYGQMAAAYGVERFERRRAEHGCLCLP